MSSEQAETPMTDENETRVPLLERIYFNGGPMTPEKLRKLSVDIIANIEDPTATALLSGCAVTFLRACAQMLENKGGDIRQ